MTTLKTTLNERPATDTPFTPTADIAESNVQDAIEAVASTAAADLAAHVAAADPHPTYLTQAEGDAAYQPLDSDLTTIAGLSTADGNFIVGNGSAWTTESGATARASLGLVIGTDVQRFSFINVKDYGAVGDGATDDTTAIMNAINTGDCVYFPEGTYILGNSTFPSSFCICGDGMGRSIIQWKASSSEANLMAVSGAVKGCIRDVTIDGNRQNNTDSTGYYGSIGGTISDGARLSFHNVEFKNGRIVDIYLTGPTASGEYAEVLIDGCRFYDGLVGTLSRSAQAVSASEGIRLRVVGSVFKQPTGPASYGRGGVVMQRPAGSTAASWGQFEASGNNFENFGRTTADTLGCLYVYSGSNLTAISSNMFLNSYGSAITVKADCGTTTITGNVVNGHTDATGAAISCFGQADTLTTQLARNLLIDGNVVRSPQQTSIFVDGARTGTGNASNAIVSNNVCDGGVRGIHVRDVIGAKIVGNLIYNTSGIGIVIEDCDEDYDITNNTIAVGSVGIDLTTSVTSSAARFNIVNNIVTDMTGTAIRLRTAVESFNISNNSIAGCTTAISTVGATAASAVKNNLIRGETTSYSRTGSYSGLQYEGNITSVAMAFATRELTIASGAITVVHDWHWVDTEADAASDDLDTINGGYEGRTVILRPASNSRNVRIRNGTGNITLSGDVTLVSTSDNIVLQFIGSTWQEISVDAPSRTIASADAGATVGPDLILYRNSATPAASDVIGQVRFDGEDSAGNIETYASVRASISDPTSTSEDGELFFGVVTAGVFAEEVKLSGAALYPATSDGNALGTSSNMWADLFLASGSVVNWSAGDVTLTHSADTLSFAGATNYFFDARIVVGTAAVGTPRFQVNGTDFGTTTFGFSRFSNDTQSPFFQFTKSRGATLNTNTIVASGDILGIISFDGADGGSSYPNAAQIRGIVDATPAVGDMPGRLTFLTSTDGTTTLAERMRIDSLGNVIVNTAAISTSATDGFLYVPTCAGTPTGTPTTYTGRAPIVVNTTNNKLYFYSGGAWRDAGP